VDFGIVGSGFCWQDALMQPIVSKHWWISD